MNVPKKHLAITLVIFIPKMPIWVYFAGPWNGI
jgi:hypothetical protein